MYLLLWLAKLVARVELEFVSFEKEKDRDLPLTTFSDSSRDSNEYKRVLIADWCKKQKKVYTGVCLVTICALGYTWKEKFMVGCCSALCRDNPRRILQALNWLERVNTIASYKHRALPLIRSPFSCFTDDNFSFKSKIKLHPLT